MKKNLLFYAMAALFVAGLSSCTDNEITTGGNDSGKNPTAGEAYASISITIPNSGNTVTRDQPEDSGDYETGTAEEYKVSNVKLYFFNKFVLDAEGKPTATATTEANATCVQTTTITEFPQKEEDANKNIVYNSVVTKLQVGTYRVYAIVNGNLSATGTTIESDFKASAAAITAEMGGTPPASGLLMASRTASGLTSVPCVDVEITENNTITNPAPVVFSVERLVARIDVTKSSAASYTLATSGGTNYATVVVESFTLLNQLKNYYYFRQVGEFNVGTKTLATNGRTFGNLPASDDGKDYYVLDPKTIDKKDISAETPTTLAALFLNPFGSTSSTYTAVPAQAATEPAKLYTYENTMFKDQQVAGYSTALVFKAKVTPLNLTYMNGATLTTTTEASVIAAQLALSPSYLYSGSRFYTTIAAMKESGFDIQVGGSDLTDMMLASAVTQANSGNTTALDNIKTVFTTLGISFLQDGYCYYSYRINHYGTGTPEAVNKMLPMEFAVVRNNLYRITVNGVKGIGDDEPNGGGGPEDPDKTNEVYLQVTMSVMPWILRETSIILQ